MLIYSFSQKYMLMEIYSYINPEFVKIVQGI